MRLTNGIGIIKTLYILDDNVSQSVFEGKGRIMKKNKTENTRKSNKKKVEKWKEKANDKGILGRIVHFV